MPKENTTIDEDLYNGLQQARKKKPRYFALIAKGVEVVGLIVQKKVINSGVAQKAKAESKGNLVIQGICQGEGVELRFEVVGSEPSIAPKKIKDFIEERTELSLKPQWAVVTELAAVVDDEAKPADTPVASSTPVTDPGPTAEVPPPAPPAPPVDVKGLQARLKKLLERHKDLVGKNPDLKEKLQPLAKPAAELVMKGSAEASTALDNLEKALNLAESGGQQSSSSKQQEWKAEHARVEPRYLEVLSGNPPDAAKIRAVMAYATEQADLGGYDKALVALKRLEPLLAAATVSPEPGRLDPERIQELESQLEAATAKRTSAAEEKASKPGLGKWPAVRQDAVSKLRTLAKNLASAQHVRAKEAEGEVQDVIKKLTAKPAAVKEVAELESYLNKDPVVADICKLAFDFRAPLLGELDSLKAILAA
jgi:hypothetical protein